MHPSPMTHRESSMRILLDTQAWLWMLMAPERFSRRSLRIVEKTKNELVLSAASAWEIGIKHKLGRLELPGTPSIGSLWPRPRLKVSRS